MLGREALGEALTRIAVEWASTFAEPIVIAPEALRDAVSGAGEVIAVAANTPRLGRVHAEAVRSDLAAGVDLSLGPGLTGGWYLAGLSEPHATALELLESGAARERTFAIGDELAVGLLRAERLIREEADVKAFVRDPLVPQDVRALMR